MFVKLLKQVSHCKHMCYWHGRDTSFRPLSSLARNLSCASKEACSLSNDTSINECAPAVCTQNIAEHCSTSDARCRSDHNTDSLMSLQGAVAVSAYVTHGVFPKDSWKRFTASNSSNGSGEPDFKHFWITDSCPRTVQAVENIAPFQVLSLAEPIAAALQI